MASVEAYNCACSGNGKAISITLTESGSRVVVPCSILDHVLYYTNDPCPMRLFSPITGLEVSKENFMDYVRQVRELNAKQEYDTTDHLFVSVECDGVQFLSISLDSSTRANCNEAAAYRRLPRLCESIMSCLDGLSSENVIVMFSEACRVSFDSRKDVLGKEIKENVTPWYEINDGIESGLRQEICLRCGLQFLGECTNNGPTNGMSFGVAAFCTESCGSLIREVIPERILTEGFGSGAVGIQLQTGSVVWCVQIPLDFKNVGLENLGAKAVEGLVKAMESHPGSRCAFGDFNTIPGNTMRSITEAVPDTMTLGFWDFPTFYGSYFDTLVARDNEVWDLI